MSIKTHTQYELYDSNNFSNCCGSTYRNNTRRERKWKNQYGEGVKMVGGNADPIAMNNLGIFMCEGFAGKKGTYDKGTVYHIKTANGDITIGIREIM